ncbi:MAG: hypothetical protein Q9208_003423 [Pyrenodesmia sp. 3 TL-2023]
MALPDLITGDGQPTLKHSASDFGLIRNSRTCDERDREYALSRNYAASVRLNCQFFLWKAELGFNIHPRITSMSPTVAIADLATGTAIWLLDLQRELPNAHLDGFDISLEQCPPTEWLPSAISLKRWDIYSSLPLHLKGQYDIVHIRLVLLVVRGNDPAPILHNAFEMLKPGGFLQWDELDVFKAYVASTCSTIDTGSFQRAQEVTDLDTLKWVQDLPSIAAKIGFVEVEEYKYGCDLSLAKFYQDMQFLVMEEQAASPSSIENSYAESKKGLARCTPKVVIVAKKPIAGQSNTRD